MIVHLRIFAFCIGALASFVLITDIINLTALISVDSNPLYGPQKKDEKNPEHSGTCLSLQVSDSVDDRVTPGSDEARKCLLYTRPTPYIDLLMKVAVGLPNQGSRTGSKTKVFNPVTRYYGNDWPPFGYTMIGNARLENFRAAIEEVNRNKIPGVIIEMGVWRGGAMIMAAAVMNEYKSLYGGTMGRDLYVLDAFEEITKNQYGANSDFLFNTEQDVRNNFELLDIFRDNEGSNERVAVHFRKGLFQSTVPALATDSNIENIAVFRVDGNFYDSYQDALYYGYEKISIGGIIIFDDVMSHPAVMRCWNDFKKDQGLTEDLNRIDRHSAWFRKEAEVVLDMAKIRPPQDINK
mmetsp:Transcript_42229/g.82878  ORF Transcript_42229/g.82878 Transcript_42229/m.82878 type:complete len:351 (+) Transcript_42229:37-1089(+)